MTSDLHALVESLQENLINVATGGVRELSNSYEEIRKYLVSQIDLPKILIDNRSKDQFRQFIKKEFPSYAERRRYIWNEFNPVFLELEKENKLEEVLEINDSKLSTYSKNLLRKAQRRLEEGDYEGCITLSRSLIENCIKKIYEDVYGTKFISEKDLSKDFKSILKIFNIHETKSASLQLRQIVNGLLSSIEGIGAISSKLGDRHGDHDLIGNKGLATFTYNASLTIINFLVDILDRNIYSIKDYYEKILEEINKGMPQSYQSYGKRSKYKHNMSIEDIKEDAILQDIIGKIDPHVAEEIVKYAIKNIIVKDRFQASRLTCFIKMFIDNIDPNAIKNVIQVNVNNDQFPVGYFIKEVYEHNNKIVSKKFIQELIKDNPELKKYLTNEGVI